VFVQVGLTLRICLSLRFGDQMNNVAVTDGDKVAAEQVLGYHVDYMPFSDVMVYFNDVKDADVDALVAVYFKDYAHDKASRRQEHRSL
jgi:L-arabinose isomerase